MTPERDFVLDRLPDAPGVVVGLGAAHGFKFASVIGRILVELALDGNDAVGARAGGLPDRPAGAPRRGPAAPAPRLSDRPASRSLHATAACATVPPIRPATVTDPDERDGSRERSGPSWRRSRCDRPRAPSWAESWPSPASSARCSCLPRRRPPPQGEQDPSGGHRPGPAGHEPVAFGDRRRLRDLHPQLRPAGRVRAGPGARCPASPSRGHRPRTA